MITRLFADVRELHPVPGANDEHPPLLPRIAYRRPLALPFPDGAQPAQDDAGTERAAQAALQAGGGVRPQLWIDVERTFHMLAVAEIAGMLRPAVADDDQLGSTPADLRKRVAQLRNLLAAEDSAKVADEGEHDRLLAPEITEAHGLSVRVKH